MQEYGQFATIPFMKTDNQKLNKLYQLSHEISLLAGAESLLHWDQETYMPLGGMENRAEQLKVLAGLLHQKKTAPSYAKALSQLIDLKTGQLVSGLTEQEQAAVKLWHRDYHLDKALPKKFVEEFSKLTSHAAMAWREAKESNDFSKFSPFLERIVQAVKKKADYIGYKKHPYDALIDLYEPGMTTEEISLLFKELRNSISSLLKKITAKKSHDDSFLFGVFESEKQIEFSHELLKVMHYDLDKGRLDFSSHPFSSASHPTDSRITTRIHPSSLMSNIFAVLHEAGHALYEMGLPIEWFGTPLGQALSLGMHESQSRWWETRVGHSLYFWQHFFPKLQTYFPMLKTVSLEKFYHAINSVRPSFIRIEADEVTYSLHVILRFELEVALIEGQLKVKDLPAAWNSKMQELFGIEPATHREGCLQDIHWSLGAFGYFPTYTLGNLYAAQLFEAYNKQNPQWQKEIAQGELLPMKTWLNQHVHQHGRRYSSKELLLKATGETLSCAPYLNYLNNKFM